MSRRFTIKQLQDSFMSQAPSKGLAYVPELMKQTPRAERTGKNKQPDWAIVSWVAKPEAMSAPIQEEAKIEAASDDDF